MATFVLQFRGKGIWLSRGVAEVWLCALARKLEASTPVSWAEILRGKILEALSYDWITGVLIADIDEAISDDAALREFLVIVAEVEQELFKAAANSEDVRVGNFTVLRQVLVPEVEMISVLLSEPETIPDPPPIFRMGEGWH